MDEVWHPVPSKPGVMASSLGRIRLPASTATMPHGGKRSYKPAPVVGVVRKAAKNARHRYYGLYSRRFGNLKVHRLICEAFHGPPPFEGAVVIHIDENALNNRADNLKWGTQRENLNMPGFVAYCRARKGAESPVIKARMKRHSTNEAPSR